MKNVCVAVLATLAVTGTVGAASALSVHPADNGIQLAGFGVPLPADPPPAVPAAGDVPTPDQVTDILNRLTDPGYPDKSGLVQGGLSPEESQDLADDLGKFEAHGELPYNFTASNIDPAPNNMAGATIAITGPKTPIPQIQPIALVNQGGNWLLLQDSYDQLMGILTRDDRPRHRSHWHQPFIMPMIVP